MGLGETWDGTPNFHCYYGVGNITSIIYISPQPVHPVREVGPLPQPFHRQPLLRSHSHRVIPNPYRRAWVRGCLQILWFSSSNGAVKPIISATITSGSSGYVVYCHQILVGGAIITATIGGTSYTSRSYGIVYIHWDWNPHHIHVCLAIQRCGAEPMELPGLRRKLIGVQRY